MEQPTPMSGLDKDEHLMELLLRWDELRAHNEEPSVDELCRDRPELALELGERIHLLLAFEPPCDVDARDRLGGTGTLAENHTTQASASPGGAPLRYRQLRSHAKGGIGEVYIASDEEMKREVALKEIQSQFSWDPGSRSRFLLEAEITGSLEHPGIVPVYGVGKHDDGRPFYVMRFIKGQTLMEAIREFHQANAGDHVPGGRSLALRGLLRRLIDVCNAVTYAHSRGVLHRDLKPSNVMLGPFGETLVVDWGLAKCLSRDDSSVDELNCALKPYAAEELPATQIGSVFGTPAFMSPEQAEGRSGDIAPATDVYGLGGTLYAMLTGEAPFAAESYHVPLSNFAKRRLTPPSAINPSLPRSLEAICQKAMAYRVEDRYTSRQELADDLERWLGDEPVTACEEPWIDGARRWLSRRRAAVTAISLTLTAGFLGLAAVAGVQAHANGQLKKANALTSLALVEMEKSQDKMQKALEQSEASRQQADAVRNFMVDAFRRADPSQDGRQVKVADVMDKASEKLETDLATSEATRAVLFQVLGDTYFGLGLYARAAGLHAKAHRLRERVLGQCHPETLLTRDSLGNDYWCSGQFAEAATLHAETLAIREITFGHSHPGTLTTRHNLAVAYRNVGRTSEAIALEEENIKWRAALLGPGHPDTLLSRNNLANSYKDAGRLTDALVLHEATLKLREARLGLYHVDTLTSRNNVGVAYRDAGRYSEALALFEATSKIRVSALGPDHPDTLFVTYLRATLPSSVLICSNVSAGRRPSRYCTSVFRSARASQSTIGGASTR
jgi:serine/threonine protein kinase